RKAISSFDAFAVGAIRTDHDTLRLVGQDNFRRYQPLTHIRIRVEPSDSCLDLCVRAAAVVAAGARAAISHAERVHAAWMDLMEELTHEWAGDMEFLEESDQELAEAILQGQVDRVRYAGTGNVPVKIREAAEQR